MRPESNRRSRSCAPSTTTSRAGLPAHEAAARSRPVLRFGRLDGGPARRRMERHWLRIQREAIEAAGHFIPLVVENVRGAIPWVGRSRWNHGSFHLWGDVPALMPITVRTAKVGSLGWSEFAKTGVKSKGFNTTADQLAHGRADVTGTHFADDLGPADDGPKYILDDMRAGKRRVAGGVYDGETGRTTKNDGGSWFNVAHNTTSGTGRNPDGRKGSSAAGWFGEYSPADGTKQGGDWFDDPTSISRRSSSKSSARKAASARIAKIPLPIARHIAKAWYPRTMSE